MRFRADQVYFSPIDHLSAAQCLAQYAFLGTAHRLESSLFHSYLGGTKIRPLHPFPGLLLCKLAVHKELDVHLCLIPAILRMACMSIERLPIGRICREESLSLLGKQSLGPCRWVLMMRHSSRVYCHMQKYGKVQVQ